MGIHVQSINMPLVSKNTAQQDIQMNTIQFLKTVSLFSELDDRQLDSIAQDCQPRHYAQGDIIFHEGDPGQVLYINQTGQVRIYVNGLDGSETSVILFGRPGDIFGELAVIDGLPRSATAVALDDTDLLIIGREPFRQHMRQHSQLALNFMKELTRRVRYNTRQMDTLASLPVPKRLARKLMDLAQDYGRVQETGVFIDLHLPQAILAGMVGATRERVNKCLRDFRKESWIQLDQGYITILDPEALRELISQ